MYSYRKMPALITGIILVILYLILYGRSTDFNDLSVAQLEASGYYIYLLPEQIQENLNWIRRIRMRSFDFHCITQMDSRDDRWNPIQITYSDSELGTGMVIWISPYDAMFDRREVEPITQISPYGTHYEIDPAGRLRFVDDLGIDVVITSQLPIETTLSLVSQLVQVGHKGAINPWEENCR